MNENLQHINNNITSINTHTAGLVLCKHPHCLARRRPFSNRYACNSGQSGFGSSYQDLGATTIKLQQSGDTSSHATEYVIMTARCVTWARKPGKTEDPITSTASGKGSGPRD